MLCRPAAHSVFRRRSHDGDGELLAVMKRRDVWIRLASSFRIRDMPNARSTRTHVSDLPGSGSPCEKAVIGHVMQRLYRRFPAVDGIQGFEVAAKLICRAMGEDAGATPVVFEKWAVPVGGLLFDSSPTAVSISKVMALVRRVFVASASLTWAWLLRDRQIHLGDEGMTEDDQSLALYLHAFHSPLVCLHARSGLSRQVLYALLTKTLQAGVNGPAISLWVEIAVLCLAAKNEKGGQGAVFAHHSAIVASLKVSTFEDLEDGAPMPLENFIEAYRLTINPPTTRHE
ncbi:unnamed protein product [Discosporangium mesarthrocarpum]